METIKIEIVIEKTANAKVVKVGGSLCAGKGEVKAALMDAAKAQIEAVLGELFPGKVA